MSDDLTRLRTIAAAATPGPWEYVHDAGLVRADTPDEPVFLVTDCIESLPTDAIFIATFDPPTVTALIDRVERAERERDRLDGELSLARGTFELMRDELAALRAAVAGLADEVCTCEGETCDEDRGCFHLRALLTDEGDNDGR